MGGVSFCWIPFCLLHAWQTPPRTEDRSFETEDVRSRFRKTKGKVKFMELDEVPLLSSLKADEHVRSDELMGRMLRKVTSLSLYRLSLRDTVQFACRSGSEEAVDALFPWLPQTSSESFKCTFPISDLEGEGEKSPYG